MTHTSTTTDEHPIEIQGTHRSLAGSQPNNCVVDVCYRAALSLLGVSFEIFLSSERKGRLVVDYESSAQGTLEHKDGKYRVTQIAVQLRISLKSEDDVEAAREATKDAAESCMISNSILATVQLDPQFNARSGSA